MSLFLETCFSLKFPSSINKTITDKFWFTEFYHNLPHVDRAGYAAYEYAGYAAYDATVATGAYAAVATTGAAYAAYP